MAKKKLHKQNWTRNIQTSTDTYFLNSIHWYTPDDFEHILPLGYCELCCDYLNKLRIEYATLANNGMPVKTYAEDVKEKILARKNERLIRKRHKAEMFMKHNGMKLKDGFDRLNKNQKPRFSYEDKED